MVMNINWFISILNYDLYGLFVINFLRQDNKYNGVNIFERYIGAFLFMHLMFSLFLYYDLKNKKSGFLLHQKIFRMIKEQNTIFDQLPDGVVLFKERQNNLNEGDPCLD